MAIDKIFKGYRLTERVIGLIAVEAAKRGLRTNAVVEEAINLWFTTKYPNVDERQAIEAMIVVPKVEQGQV